MVFFGIRATYNHKLLDCVEFFRHNLIEKQGAIMFANDSSIEVGGLSDDLRTCNVYVYLNPIFNKSIFYMLTIFVLGISFLIQNYKLVYILIPFWVTYIFIDDIIGLLFIKGLRKQGYKDTAKVL